MQSQESHVPASDAVAAQPETISTGLPPDAAAAFDASARIAELETQLTEAKDQFLRARAEQENQRRRAVEDLQAANKYAVQKFAAEMLPVKDSLEMALLDQSGQFDTLKHGVDLTLKQLISAFEKFQLSEINPVGEKLDPHKHQAISMIEADADANTVVNVMQKGYQIAERVLRPAMVVVAKGK